MMKLMLVVLISACSLPYVKPQPRTPEVAQRAVARLDIRCESDGQVYREPAFATGVVISERHILTAGHAVVCPVLPKIKATFYDGHWERMYVERDEFSYGDGRDIARLKLHSNSGFNLNIPPPTLHEFGNGPAIAAVANRRPEAWYPMSDAPPTVIPNMITRAGDSGAGVYVRGKLLGIVTRSGDAHTRIEVIDGSLLEDM